MIIARVFRARLIRVFSSQSYWCVLFLRDRAPRRSGFVFFFSDCIEVITDNAFYVLSRTRTRAGMIVLEVLEDVATILVSIAISFFALSVRGVRFCLRPHLVQLFSRRRRADEYELLHEDVVEIVSEKNEKLKRLDIEFALPIHTSELATARIIRVLPEDMAMDEKLIDRESWLHSEFLMRVSIFTSAKRGDEEASILATVTATARDAFISNKKMVENTIVFLNSSGATSTQIEKSGIVEQWVNEGFSVICMDLRGQGETEACEIGSLQVLAYDVLAILRVFENDDNRKEFHIGQRIHLVGHSIGAGVAMHIGIILSSRRDIRGRMRTPKSVASLSIFGFTSKYCADETRIERILTNALTSEMFIRSVGIKGFMSLMSLSIKPNVEALNEPNHITVKSLRYYSSETNSIDGFVNQVKTWRSFDVSASIHEIEIPTLILHTAGDERAGHTKASKLKDCERIGKPLCDFREIEGDYSHLLPYETPEKFCSAVTEFVTNERVSASCRRL